MDRRRAPDPRLLTRRALGLFALVAVLSACTTHLPFGAGTGRSSSRAAVAWTDCADGFQCAELPVPLDYSNPSGRTISLALIRKPALQTYGPRIGSLLVNPGGPGDSGVDFLRNAGTMLDNLNQWFDLVSWDTRGVGGSAPVTCEDGPELDRYLALDSVLDDPAEKQAFIQATQDFTAGCEQRSGYLLPFMDSASTARDMDQIRQALGDSKLTYLGFSYGTYIGQWYAHLFPTRVRALSLDGVVDSTAEDSLTGQVAGFEQNLQAFLAS